MNAIHFIIKSEFWDRRKRSISELFYGTPDEARAEAQKRSDALHRKGCSNIIIRIYTVRVLEYSGSIR